MRFYQQIKDNEDLAMLVVPPKFVEVMNTWLVVNPKWHKLTGIGIHDPASNVSVISE